MTTVAVIGLGVGAGRLDASATAVLARAEVLVGGARQLAAFPEHPAERLVIAAPLSRTLDALAAAAAAGKRVVVLADGDPLYFGIGRALLARLGPEALTFYPNVTAVAAAAATLKRPWQDLPVVSLHGRSDRTPLFAALRRQGRAMVLTDADQTPAVIAVAVLTRAGDRFAMTVLENLGLPDERIRRLSLTEAADCTAAPLNVVFLEATRPPEVALTLGLADEALLRPDGVFTKLPVRALALAALAPRPGDVVYDVGAGAGTVAVEASLLNAGGPVFAVERDPGRHARLMDNIRRTGALTVTPILGEAPEALVDRPDPDRVFVGGGLTDRPDLLDVLIRRLRPGGRLAVAAVLLGSIERARAVLSRSGLSLSVMQVQASQAVPLAGDLHFRAENPVCILTAVKEALS